MPLTGRGRKVGSIAADARNAEGASTACPGRPRTGIPGLRASAPVYGRHAGLWPFEKISPLLVPSVLTYRSEPAQLRHAWIEKPIVLPSGDHVVLENPPACARIFSSDPSGRSRSLGFLQRRTYNRISFYVRII